MEQYTVLIKVNYQHSEVKPVDVKSSIYIDFDKKNKCKCPKSKIGNGLRTPKCKNIFEKAYV